MKNVWKWILGILIVLVVVAGIVGLVFVARNHMLTANFQPGYGYQQQGGGLQPRGWNNGPTMRGNNFGGPMMNGRGFDRFNRMPFFGMGFLFGGFMHLIPLALLVLIVVGAYLIGKNTMKPATVAATPAPVIATHACANCGATVQDGSSFCPSCGQKQ